MLKDWYWRNELTIFVNMEINTSEPYSLIIKYLVLFLRIITKVYNTQHTGKFTPVLHLEI